MRRTTTIFLAVACLMAVAASAQGLKLGFVNTLEVLYGTEEGKVEIEKLNQFGSQKQQEIATQGQELQRLKDQYATQQRTLNPATRSEMERTITERDRRLARLQEDVQLEYNQLRDTLLGRMGDKIQKIIEEYAPANGFSVVFLRDQSQTYVDPSVDITQEIIRIYNERNPVQGAAPSGAQPPSR